MEETHLEGVVSTLFWKAKSSLLLLYDPVGSSKVEFRYSKNSPQSYIFV